MSLEAKLREMLTAAMKQKDRRTSDLIRMINTKIMEKRTAKNFTGEVDDKLYLETIAAYRKSLAKAEQEYAGYGEKGADKVEELKWEIAFLDQFLPKQLGEEDLQLAVKEALAESGITDAKQAGRVVGVVMKKHKGLVDAGRVQAEVKKQLA